MERRDFLKGLAAIPAFFGVKALADEVPRATVPVEKVAEAKEILDARGDYGPMGSFSLHMGWKPGYPERFPTGIRVLVGLVVVNDAGRKRTWRFEDIATDEEMVVAAREAMVAKARELAHTYGALEPATTTGEIVPL